MPEQAEGSRRPPAASRPRPPPPTTAAHAGPGRASRGAQARARTGSGCSGAWSRRGRPPAAPSGGRAPPGPGPRQPLAKGHIRAKGGQMRVRAAMRGSGRSRSTSTWSVKGHIRKRAQGGQVRGCEGGGARVQLHPQLAESGCGRLRQGGRRGRTRARGGGGRAVSLQALHLAPPLAAGAGRRVGSRCESQGVAPGRQGRSSRPLQQQQPPRSSGASTRQQQRRRHLISRCSVSTGAATWASSS